LIQLKKDDAQKQGPSPLHANSTSGLLLFISFGPCPNCKKIDELIVTFSLFPIAILEIEISDIDSTRFLYYELHLIFKFTDNQLVVDYFLLHPIGVRNYSPNSLIFFQFQSHLETYCIFPSNLFHLDALRYFSVVLAFGFNDFSPSKKSLTIFYSKTAKDIFMGYCILNGFQPINLLLLVWPRS
jgi:hypothetical protein